MSLKKIMFYEGTELSKLTGSPHKSLLETKENRLKRFEQDIKSQPDGKIELKEDRNWVITGFGENNRKLISKILHSEP